MVQDHQGLRHLPGVGEEAGGDTLPLVMARRVEEQLHAAVAQAAESFGINKASAINLARTEEIELRRFAC